MARVHSDEKLVVSASRRTELLGRYPDYLLAKLKEIGSQRIHSVVFWTKQVDNLLVRDDLRSFLTKVGQVFIQWTVTGLGGSCLEPQVPRMEEQLALIPEIVAFAGDPRRIHWRFDPLVSAEWQGKRISNIDPELFYAIGNEFAKAGVGTVHFSFVENYAKVARRLAGLGMTFHEWNQAERRAILENLKRQAESIEMKLMTCCVADNPVGRCINGELLTSLHPKGEPCRTDKARGQRKLCGCTASLDIGRYLPCPNKCVYCYAHPAKMATP